MQYTCQSRILIFCLSSLIILLCSGCANQPFTPPEFNKQVVVDVTINDSIGYDSEGRRIVGQAKRVGGICYLQLPTITWLYDSYNMCVWGHEFMHCVFGRFHTKDAMGTC